MKQILLRVGVLAILGMAISACVLVIFVGVPSAVQMKKEYRPAETQTTEAHLATGDVLVFELFFRGRNVFLERTSPFFVAESSPPQRSLYIKWVETGDKELITKRPRGITPVVQCRLWTNDTIAVVQTPYSLYAETEP